MDAGDRSSRPWLERPPPRSRSRSRIGGPSAPASAAPSTSARSGSGRRHTWAGTRTPSADAAAEQQHVGRAVDVEVVEHRVDPRASRIDLCLDHAQEVDPIGRGATLEGQGESLAAHWLQRAEDVPGHTAPAIVDLLLSPPSFRAGRSHELLAWVALAGLRPHLVETGDNAAGRWRRVELLDRPLLRAKSGSTRAPNQVSSCRHLRPSWMKISLIRLRRMAIPCWLRWTTRRSSVQQANGRPRSAGRVRAAVITALRCSAE